MFKTTIFWAALALAGASSAMAAEPRMHEITGGSNSNLRFGEDSTSVGLDGGYRYAILPDYGLQAGLETSVNYQTANNTGTTNWTNVFGLRYNLDRAASFLQEVFVDAGLGFRFQRAAAAGQSNNDTNFLYQFGLGKRFLLSDRVSYTPAVQLRHVADEGFNFQAQILAFSFFL